MYRKENNMYRKENNMCRKENNMHKENNMQRLLTISVLAIAFVVVEIGRASCRDRA